MVTLSALLRGAQPALAQSLVDAVASSESPIALLADFAEALPGPLRNPDAIPSVPTGASEISRADAFTYAALARLRASSRRSDRRLPAWSWAATPSSLPRLTTTR